MSADQKAFSRRAAPPRLDQPDDRLHAHSDELPAEIMPPVGKMGGDTSRADWRPRLESAARVEDAPSPGVATRADAASRESAAQREDAYEAPPIQPHSRRRVPNLVWAIAGIAAVIALVVVALAVSMGHLSLPSPRGRTEIDLQGGSLKGANLQGADLSEADLGGADLNEADLRGANAQRANLHRANLARADLHYALLNEANLREADLREANLQWVDLGDADLQDAQLEGANVKYARLDGATLPDGSRWSVSIDMRRFTDPTYRDFWRP